MCEHYLYKDNQGQDHISKITFTETENIKSHFQECFQSLMPTYYEILYASEDGRVKNDWTAFYEKLNLKFRLTDDKTIYEAHFDVENLKSQIIDRDDEWFDYKGAVEKLTKMAIENPIQYPVIKILSDSEWKEYSMKELDVLEKKNDFSKTSFKQIKEGWDYQPIYSEYDAYSTLREDHFTHRVYLGLLSQDDCTLGMSCISINTVDNELKFCPETDVYFVNKDGERLRIDPSGKLGVRLVELTQKYLQINEKDIKTKFEKDVRIFRDSLPITVLPNARAFYRCNEEKSTPDIYVNVNDVENLNKENALKELIRALIIKRAACRYSQNERFENDVDWNKYSYQRGWFVKVYVTDGQTLWSARSKPWLSKKIQNSLLKTIRSIQKFEDFKEIGPVDEVIPINEDTPLQSSIRFDQDFDWYVAWCMENRGEYHPLSTEYL